MAASETKLGALHDKVAEVLTVLLDGQDLPTGEQDDEGNMITQKLEPSAAIITSAIQFLKNNNITCTPAEGNALGELADKVRARTERLKARRADLLTARDDASFMTGMPN